LGSGATADARRRARPEWCYGASARTEYTFDAVAVGRGEEGDEVVTRGCQPLVVPEEEASTC
jgi:hypothetical protein